MQCRPLPGLIVPVVGALTLDSSWLSGMPLAIRPARPLKPRILPCSPWREELDMEGGACLQ